MKKSLILLFCVYLTGCVAGQEYNYEASSMDIPVKPSEKRVLILSVQDLRPYVLSGDKESNFVGLQRGGFGEPWGVTTASGDPMTEDMSEAIVSGLKDAGYNVFNTPGKNEVSYLTKTASKHDASRIVILKVFEWKSDVYMNVTLHCDLELNILDVEGKLLAKSSDKFIGSIAGGSWATTDKNSKAMTDEFTKRVRNLFTTDEVRKTLQ